MDTKNIKTVNMNGVKSLPNKNVPNGMPTNNNSNLKKKQVIKKDENNNNNNNINNGNNNNTNKNNIKNASNATPNKLINNPRMLESFWKLSEYDYTIRLAGINEITKYFGTLDQTSNKESYNYVLMRLLKGLASNRKCSRLGYSLALTELITQFDSLTFEYVNDLAQHYLKITTTNQHAPSNNNDEDDEYDTSLSKEEIRHMQIGLVFVYLCWIQSNRLFKHDLNDKTNSESTKNLNIIKRILKDLNEMRLNTEFKTYIQQLYLQALILLIKKITSNELFSTLVLPVIEDDLKNVFQSSNNQLNKDNFNLLLTCLNKYNFEMKKFLKANKLDLNLVISIKNADYFYELISQSSEFLPKLEPVCTEFFEYLSTHETTLFKDFWVQYLDARLYSRREPEKKYLGFKLFIYSLGLLNDSNKLVFYDGLLKCNNLLYNFIFSYTNKYNNLNPVCRETVAKEMGESVKKLENENLSMSMGADLTIKLIEYSKNCHDISDLINMLSFNLNETSLVKYFDFLINDYLKEDSNYLKNVPKQQENGSKSDNEDEEYELKTKTDLLISKQLWVISQISHLSKNNHLFESDCGLIKRILTYLSIQSYFESDEKTFGDRMLKNEKIDNELNETILEFIGIIFSKHESKYHSVLIDLVQSLQNFMGSNINNSKNGKNKTMIQVKLNERFEKRANDYKTLCSRMAKLLSNINNSMQSLNTNGSEHNHHGQPDLATLNKDIYETFFIIISIECFRMFDSFKNSQQAIEDVEICFEKFTNELKSQGKKSLNHTNNSEDEIEWIDVLVELLLNLFSINKHWIRNIAKLQFRKIFPKLTTKSVKLIIDILSPESENELLVEEDEEMDDCDDHEHSDDEEQQDNDDEEAINEKVKKRKNSEKADEEDDEDDEDEDEDDDDEEEEDDGEIDQEFKNSLMKSLGSAAMVGDDEENDEGANSDLDDEAMMKLDESIASAFKLRKKDKKHEINLIQYKLRALDFIQELMKSTYRLDLISFLIKPLLEILFESQTKPNLKIVSQRILGFVQNLKNTTKKINESKLPSVDELFELLDYIIKASTLHFNVINTLVESSMFCVRLIQFSANSCSNETEKNSILKKLTDIYLDIIKNDKSKINPIMYKEYLLRYPSYSIVLATQLIDSISCNDVKLHKKTVTMVTLYQCINNQMFSEVNQSGSSDLLNKLFSFFYKTIDESISDENVHIKFVDAFLNLVTRVLNLQKNLINKSHLEGLVTKLNVFVKDTKIKQAYKSRFSNLIGICNRSLK